MQVNHLMLTSLFCLFFSNFYSSILFALEAKPASADTNHLQNCSEEVITQEGAVRGHISYKNELKTCRYLGIPYAKAPINELRWTAPQKPELRNAVLEAKSYGPDCMQNRWLSDATIKSTATETSEDCLYLNIWKPTKPGKYPVMLWIHGGGLFVGSAAWPIYDATSLVSRNDVVVVTINYRLGALGYFSHPALVNQDDGFEGGSSGNYGLLDQVQALRWVQENIENFNGDANNVTIFGESAGGWSVFNLLTTPASEGLFHKAISQSGGSDTSYTNEEAFNIGERFAKRLDCDKNKNIALCLRKVPAEKIIEQSTLANGRCMITGSKGKYFCFIPREDGKLLPASSFESIQAGEYKKIPLIAGYNSKDIWFLKSSTINSLNLMEDNPVWMYEFKFKKNAFNFFSSGVHGIELPFLFDTLSDFKVFHNKFSLFNDKHVDKAQNLVEEMQSYWTNFAKSGNPNLNKSIIDVESIREQSIEDKTSSAPYWSEFKRKNYLFLSNISILENTD